MTARSALTVVGQVVGSYFGPVGSAIGGAIGGVIGGAIDGPTKNTQGLIDDLGAIKFDYGSTWPRLYGEYMFKVAPMWSSVKRPVKHTEEVDEKGGPSQENTTITYVQDWLCWAPLGAIGVGRIRLNGEMKYSALASSDDASLVASNETSAWGSMTFLDGNAAQMPWAVYEAAVGTDNAVAYRHRPMIAFESLDLGAGGQPPLIEVEFISAGTVGFNTVVQEVYAVDLSDSLGNQSGMGSFVGGAGHSWYAGVFGPSFTDKLFTTVTYNQTLPPPNVVLSQGDVALGDTTVNFMTGISDEDYYIVVGQTGFQVNVIDSTGAVFPSNYPTNPTDRFVSMLKYVRCGGVTLGLLGTPFQGIALLSGAFTSIGWLPHSATLYAGEWYVMPHAADGFLYKYNGLTLGANGTIADPRGNTGANGGTVLTDVITGTMYMLFGSALLKWDGATWTTYIASLPSAMQGMDTAVTPHGLTMYGGDLYSLAHIPGGDPPYVYRLSVARTLTTVDPDTVPLSDIVRSEELLEWTGEAGALTADDIDVSELTAIQVRGYATTGSPVDSVGQLMDMFYFGGVCSDKLYHPLRGKASIGTVPFDHTGMGVGQPGEPFTGLERGNDLEVPMQTAVTGPDIFTDYDPDTQTSDRLVGESVALNRYQTPVVFTPSERKGRAQTMNLDARAASHTAKVVLDDRHVEKEPFDVWVQTDDQGNTYRVRSTGETFADGIHDHDVCLDDVSVLVGTGITTEVDSRAITVVPVPLTTVIPLDVPIFRDVDNSRGIYAAAKPATSTGWGGWRFLESPDGSTYTTLAAGTKATVIGVCSVVPAGSTHRYVFNEADRIVVDVGQGVLAAATREQLVADQTVNAFAIGAHGRWLLGQFRTATLLSAGVYEIRGLLLGAKGTERYIGTQTSGDFFVLLKSTGGVLRVAQTAADHDALRYYKAVTNGRSEDTSGAATITQEEVGLMPLSVIGQRITRDASGNATITFQRRSRLAVRTAGSAGVLVPLGEESESYSVDIFTDGTYTVVKRILDPSSTPSVVYSAAAQVSDFGSLQDPIYARIYQLSALVGRGIPAEVAT